MKKIMLIPIALAICSSIYAQLSTNEQPVSFGLSIKQLNDIRESLTPVVMPVLDMSKIEEEDMEDEENNNLPRFGYPHKVNFNLDNSGTWHELPNGDKLWQLNVVCPNALSVNFCYDKFWIPEGGKLFIYSRDKSHCIGAFTSRNNKGDRINLRGFATGLVYGNDIILEYFQPNDATADAVISIEYVVHGYRYITNPQKGFGASCIYMVNVNCEEGTDWQNEKKAVAKVIVDGRYSGSGSLINTTDLSQKPYFLTANHCIGFNAPNPDYFLFYWNYEAPGCTQPGTNPSHYSTSGAVVLANNPYSDFALLKLTEDPKDLTNYTPYYLGWDRSGEAGDPGVCIHHPKGDVKKISTVKNQPTTSNVSSNTNNYSYWKVYWKSTVNGHGMTQKGSSGSPLLTASHKVIGQLYGSNCSDCSNFNSYSKYGKFSVSWTGNNNDSIQRRLDCWLDSLNIGEQTIEGLLVIPDNRLMDANQQLYSNILITSSGQLTIQGDVELMGNSRVIVEPGGVLIIDGGTLSNVELVLRPGASLQITDNGILDTRNGFYAPAGAIVDVEYGQIL